MAFNFRKSKSILPGVRLNLSKRGMSVRVGPKGVGYTAGTSGSRVTAGLPGTGVSYTTKLSKKGRGQKGSLGSGLVVGVIVLFVVFYIIGYF